MAEQIRRAMYLGIPRILIQAAVLDGCLQQLIEEQQRVFKPEDLADDKRVSLRDARHVGC
jgi:hypothetical protein